MATEHGTENTENEARARELEQQLASMSSRKFSLKKLDMGEVEMVQDVLLACNKALDTGESESKVAESIKRTFDIKYGPLCHCVVGRKYGSHVTHEKGCFLYFHVGNVAILLFKSKED